MDELARLLKKYQKSSVLLASKETLVHLRKSKFENGAYVWKASRQQDEPDTLFGFNLLVSSAIHLGWLEIEGDHIDINRYLE